MIYRGEGFARRVSHYSSDHDILLVGEGDFSFSLSLALSFRSGFNIVATSLDTHDDLMKKYKEAGSNLALLRKLGARVVHGVDATKMMNHPELGMFRFDRIIFNFPHVGFHGKEEDPQLIRMHAELVMGFFRNASAMLQPCGEVHVTHKTSKPYCDWNIVGLASNSCLTFLGEVDFGLGDYPRYRNKRGDGKRADESFFIGECSTFIFALSMAARRRRYEDIAMAVNADRRAVREPAMYGDYVGSGAAGATTTSWGRTLSDVQRQRLMSLWRLMVQLFGEHPEVAEMRLLIS